MKIKTIFIIKFLALIYQNSCFAIDKPTCFKNFTIAYFDTGYYFIQEKNAGINIDIINELKKRTGCKINAVIYPRARIWAELKMGAVDIGTNGVKINDRDQFVYFSHYSKSKNLVVLRKDIKERNLKSFLNNKMLFFGSLRGLGNASKSLHNFEIQMSKQNRIEESSEYKTLFLKLEKNHIQGFFSSYTNIKRYSKEIKGIENKYTIVDWIPNESDYLLDLMLSKKVFTEKEFKKWDHVMQSMNKDGTLKKIFLKYFTEGEYKKYFKINSDEL